MHRFTAGIETWLYFCAQPNRLALVKWRIYFLALYSRIWQRIYLNGTACYLFRLNAWFYDRQNPNIESNRETKNIESYFIRFSQSRRWRTWYDLGTRLEHRSPMRENELHFCNKNLLSKLMSENERVREISSRGNVSLYYLTQSSLFLCHFWAHWTLHAASFDTINLYQSVSRHLLKLLCVFKNYIVRGKPFSVQRKTLFHLSNLSKKFRFLSRIRCSSRFELIQLCDAQSILLHKHYLLSH